MATTKDLVLLQTNKFIKQINHTRLSLKFYFGIPKNCSSLCNGYCFCYIKDEIYSILLRQVYS